jgi:mesencephalic astrocyte-derived neurotrophic factor
MRRFVYRPCALLAQSVSCSRRQLSFSLALDLKPTRIASPLFFDLYVVCIKVMNDVRSKLSKEEARNKPAIEKAMGEYCADVDKLSAKEKKICYYIDPIKRDVAQPFSLGMDSLKLCQRINKSNPEICTVKNTVKTAKMEAADITKLRVKQLKQILADRGVECKGCVEKEEFVKKVQETEHLASNDEF